MYTVVSSQLHHTILMIVMMIMCPSMYTVVSSQLRHTSLTIVMMTVSPSMYTVVLSQLRHTILMIVAVLNLRRFVHRSMIIVLEQNFDNSDGDYVPQHVRLGITTVCNTLAVIVTVINVRRRVYFRIDHHNSSHLHCIGG